MKRNLEKFEKMYNEFRNNYDEKYEKALRKIAKEKGYLTYYNKKQDQDFYFENLDRLEYDLVKMILNKDIKLFITDEYEKQNLKEFNYDIEEYFNYILTDFETFIKYIYIHTNITLEQLKKLFDNTLEYSFCTE